MHFERYFVSFCLKAVSWRHYIIIWKCERFIVVVMLTVGVFAMSPSEFISVFLSVWSLICQMLIRLCYLLAFSCMLAKGKPLLHKALYYQMEDFTIVLVLLQTICMFWSLSTLWGWLTERQIESRMNETANINRQEWFSVALLVTIATMLSLNRKKYVGICILFLLYSNCLSAIVTPIFI